MTFSTVGSNFDTVLGVYAGSSVNALTTIASNDDDPNGGVTSRVSFSVVSGTQYQIAVDGFNGVSGNVVLNWGPALPNLTPFQPSGWSDKIVVSTITGTNTDSSPLKTTDTLYVDWAVINNGIVGTAATFYTKLYVDGAERNSWYTDPPLNGNFYAYVQDYSIGNLSAGIHTIKIVADATGTISEGNESDNEYIKTITVVAGEQPNLMPYQPSGWSDKIVVSNTTGTNTDSNPLKTTDTLYIDWAVINNGLAATGATFYTRLYVDGVERNSWFSDPPLNVNFYAYVQDYSIGSLSAGTHTIRIVADATGTISESNESDNEYTKTISIAP